MVAAQSIFENRLLAALAGLAPNINPETVLAAGASQVHQFFSGKDLNAVIQAYMIGTKDVFAFTIACTAATVVLVPLIPFKKLPSAEDKKVQDEKAAAST